MLEDNGRDHNAFKRMFVLVLLAFHASVCVMQQNEMCWARCVSLFPILCEHFSHAKGIFGMPQIGNCNKKMCTHTDRDDDGIDGCERPYGRERQ